MGMFKMRREHIIYFSNWNNYYVKTSFSIHVGIESSLQDLLGDDKISLETSVIEAGLNTRKW